MNKINYTAKALKKNPSKKGSVKEAIEKAGSEMEYDEKYILTVAQAQKFRKKVSQIYGLNHNCRQDKESIADKYSNTYGNTILDVLYFLRAYIP